MQVREFKPFGDHRTEVRRFAEMVEGGIVSFRAMSYRQLWDGWSLQPGPAWVPDQVERLRSRYEVRI